MAVALLLAVTIFYAGYNLFVKVSGTFIPATTTSTVVATICLQLAALFTSSLFLVFQTIKGGHIFSLSPGAYFWAVAAGICIGAAEIGYFYLFGGVGLEKPMEAKVAIPTIVIGTVVITTIVSAAVFGERFGLPQAAGAFLIVIGILFFFSDASASSLQPY